MRGVVQPKPAIRSRSSRFWAATSRWSTSRSAALNEIRLFDGVDAGRVALEPVRAEPSPRVTHLTYAVRER
jgi:hypothetical protein